MNSGHHMLPRCLLLSPEGPQGGHSNTQGTPGGHCDTQGTPGPQHLALPCSLPFGVRDALRVPCFFLPLGWQCLLRVCSSDSHKTGATLLETLLPFSPTHNPGASVLGILRWDAGSFHEDLMDRWLAMMFSKSGFYYCRQGRKKKEKHTAPGGMRFRDHWTETAHQASFL